jgi:hypothetical protein
MTNIKKENLEQDINLSISTDFNEDVIAGFRLFAEVSKMNLTEKDVNKWLYWFRNNPYGRGIFAIVKDKAKVVGFNALIPVKMRLNGAVINGAKAEFLGVDEAYRELTLSGETVPIPFSMVGKLYRSAAEHGIEALFGVPNKAAAACNLLAGARLFKIKGRHFFTYFKMPVYNVGAGRNKMISFAALAATTLNRNFSNIKNIFRHKKDIAEINDVSVPEDNGSSLNEFLHFDEKMFRFRFPEDRYIYLSAGDSLFIFNRPDYNQKVFLVYWNTLDIPFSSYLAIFKKIYSYCKSQGANSLHIMMPEEQSKYYSNFSKCGLNFRDETSEVYLFSPGKQKNISKKQKDWLLTDSHRNFI